MTVLGMRAKKHKHQTLFFSVFSTIQEKKAVHGGKGLSGVLALTQYKSYYHGSLAHVPDSWPLALLQVL